MRNKKKSQALTKEAVNKAEVLMGLNFCCTYFESNIQNNALFVSEYKTSKTVNSILEDKQVFTEADIANIVKIMNDIDKMEHYNGSGWLDYKIRLCHFLRLSGFDVNLF